MGKRNFAAAVRPKEKDGNVPVAGGSLLLCIFAVVCLSVFALLSVASSQADNRIYWSMQDNAELYFDADVRAQERLASIRDGGSGLDGVGVRSSGGMVHSWNEKVSDVMQLSCSVEVWPDGRYRILDWSLERSVPWEGDFSTPVYGSEKSSGAGQWIRN